MENERKIYATETSISLPVNLEHDEQKQEMLDIVGSAIDSLQFSAQLEPQKKELRTSKISDVFISLQDRCDNHWKRLSVINHFISSTNNHVVFVEEDPSEPIYDVEEIIRQEAMSGLKGTKLNLKKVFQRSLWMLQNNVTSYEEFQNLKNMSKYPRHTKVPLLYGDL